MLRRYLNFTEVDAVAFSIEQGVDVRGSDILLYSMEYPITRIRRIRLSLRGRGSLVDGRLKHVFEFQEFLTVG
jgi:hypothetical protein